jgi:hypothetical protein
MIEYNNYINREVKKVDEERLLKITEIPFHKDMYYKNINRFLASPTIEQLIGYKKYEDGSGVSAAYTRMDGITKEMIHWWNIWVEFDPLRYQMWLPSTHLFMAHPSEKDEKQLLNKKIPLHERKWGTISRMKQESGLPKWALKLLSVFGKKYGGVVEHHKRPIEIGIDESICEQKDIPSFVCSLMYLSGANYPITVLHYLVEDETGLDIHSRLWHGVQFNGKRFVRVGKKIPMKALSKSVKLCMEEFTSLGEILKEVYDAEKGSIK